MDLKADDGPMTADHQHLLGGSYPCDLRQDLCGTAHVAQRNPSAASDPDREERQYF